MADAPTAIGPVADPVEAREVGLCRRDRFLTATVPPAVAMLLSWLFLAAQHGFSRPFDPYTWFRWDSGWYRVIANRGYFIVTCHSRPGTVSPWLCGSGDWFPGYPAAIRGMSAVTGLSLIVSGLIIAWVCWYLMLTVFWQLVRDARSPMTRWACLLLAAFPPGQVYFAAYFPIGMTIGGMLGCIYFATVRRNPIAAFGCGVIAASSYPTAIVLAPALTLAAVVLSRRDQLRAMLIGAAGLATGFLAVLLYSQLSVHMWNVFFVSERKYGVGYHDPLNTIAHIVGRLFSVQESGKAYLRWVGAQTLVTCVIAVLVLGAAGYALARGNADGGESLVGRWGSWLSSRLSPMDATLAMMAVLTLLMPYVAGGHVASYRSDALIVVSLPLLRRLPAWLVAIPLCFSIFISWHIAGYFFARVIA